MLTHERVVVLEENLLTGADRIRELEREQNENENQLGISSRTQKLTYR